MNIIIIILFVLIIVICLCYYNRNILSFKETFQVPTKKEPSELTIYNYKDSSHYTVGFYFNIINDANTKSDETIFFKMFDKNHTKETTIFANNHTTDAKIITVSGDVQNEFKTGDKIYTKIQETETETEVGTVNTVTVTTTETNSITNITLLDNLKVALNNNAIIYTKNIKPLITMWFDKNNKELKIKQNNKELITPAIKIKMDVLNYVIFHIERGKPLMIYLNNNKNSNEQKIPIPYNFILDKVHYQSGDIELNADRTLVQNLNLRVGRVLILDSIIPITDLVREYSDNIDAPYYYTCPNDVFDMEKKGPFNDMEDCITKCIDNPDVTSTKNCGIELCQKACLECNKYNSNWRDNYDKRVFNCPWIKDLDDAKPQGPEPAAIRGIGGDGEITIEWVEPYNNNSPIIYYIVNIKETHNSIPTKRINIVPTNMDNKIQTYIIPDLKNKVSYDISINAVNGIAIGGESNSITVETIGEDKRLSINNIGSILEDKPVYIDSSNYSCSNQKNIENHILDKLTDKEIDIAGMVKNQFL